jgi:arsenite methyltransferase
MGLFTIDEARGVLAELAPVLAEIVERRADAAELAAALREAAPTQLGGRAELKAAEARLDELLTQVQSTGVELKGWAPLLLDFPADLDGVPVLLCWLEGEPALQWYHRTELGFLGRRRLPEQAGS